MSRAHARIIDAWVSVIQHAIALGDEMAAYRLSRALVWRCRELGVWTS